LSPSSEGGKVEMNYAGSIVFANDESGTANQVEYEELARKYSKVLIKMPEKQRTAFLMSREESLKYGEIAERLNISVKAVEKRMNGALDLLRRELIN